MLASILHIACRSVCLSFLVCMLGLRAFRYAPFQWNAADDARLGESMVRVVDLFLWPWALTHLGARHLWIGVPLVLLMLHRRLLRMEEGRLRFQPLLVSLLCVGGAWAHYVLDLSVAVALPALLLLILLLPLLGDSPLALRPAALRGWWLCWGSLAFGCVVLGGDFADRISLALWGVLLVAAARLGPLCLPTRELRIALLVALVPLNFAPSLLPLLLPLHGGTRVGDGFAYDYCELPERGLLAVSIPRCSSIPSTADGFEACQRGSIDFYDAQTLEPRQRYELFSPDYYGRLEQLLCVGDDIYVALQGTHLAGQVDDTQSAMHVPFGSPEAFRPLLAGPGLGTSIAHDPARDALLLTGEFTGDIARYERALQRVTRFEALRRPWVHPLTRARLSGSLATSIHAVDAEADRLFVWEWMQGRHAYAVDLASIEPVARYGVYSGAILGGSVDAERGRLILSSLWGIEVFDLATGELLLRKRLGFSNRPAVIDPWRDRIYIASSVDGKVRVLDRDRFEVLEQIAVGIGPRYLHLSSDGRRLFASSLRAHYAFELPPP